MKNLILLVISLAISISSGIAHAWSLTLNNGTSWGNCDQVFASEPLRYGFSYRFFDRFNNPTNQTAYIWNQNYTVEAGGFLLEWQRHPNGQAFAFSSTLAANNYAVNAGTSMEVVNTYRADWGVINRPVTRITGGADIGIKYTIGYDFTNSPSPADDTSHVECQPYYITWCGDGVVDAGYEQCDGIAGVGPGQTCNATCQIVNNPAPTCNGLTATPIFSTAPTSVSLSCATSNATSVSIACGNGQVINAATGVCIYAAAGFYPARCTVNGSITNDSCTTGVQVDTPRFDLSLKKFVNGQDAQTTAAAVVVTGGSTASYTFVVTNNGPNPVSNVTTVTDSTFSADLALQWVPTGSGWNCTREGVGFRCTRTDALAVGASFPPITALATVTSTAGTYTNTASVNNPSENPTNNFGNNNTDPANVRVDAVNPAANFDLSIKKFVNGQDAQTTLTAVSVAQNSQATYTFVVRNNGTAIVSGTTTVSDTSFGGFILPAGVPTGTGWNCTLVGLLGASGFTCTSNATVAVGTDFPTITLTANIWILNGVFTNTASVTNPNENPLNNFGNNNSDPANIVAGTVTPGLFDLSLKKYINSVTPAAQDAQDWAPLDFAANVAFNYIFVITNVATSTTAVTGTTTVTDPGPALGVDLVGTPSGTGWTCTRVARGFSCTTAATPAIGASFPNITASATTTAATGTFRNLGTVANPGDTNLTNNTDPANVRVGGGGGGGGSGPGTCESLTAVQVSGTNTVGFAMQCTPTAAAGPNPTIEIRCGNGQTINGATGTCLFNSSAGSPYQAECYVNNSTSGGPNTGCRRQLNVGASGAPLPVGSFCGDGIIDQGPRTITVRTPLGSPWICTPNFNNDAVAAIPATGTTPAVAAIPATIRDYTCTTVVAETCDAGNIWGVSIVNSVCGPNCTTVGTVTNPWRCVNGVLDCPSTRTNPFGNPLTISFDPAAAGRATIPLGSARWIIGNNIPVFDQGDRIMLSSPFPTILQGASMAIANTSGLINGSVVTHTFGNECVGAGLVDFGNGRRPCGTDENDPYFAVFTVWVNGVIGGQQFSGNTRTVPVGTALDVNPPSSPGSAILAGNFAVSLGYLVEPLSVRISRPAVSSTAGGNAFVAQVVGENVNSIAGGFLDNLRKGNFTISAATTNSSTSIASSIQPVTGLASNGSDQPQELRVASGREFDSAGFGKVWDATNVYVLKKGTVKLGSAGVPLRLSGIGTMVIEEGTLEILGDIEYADASASWAFIIKKPSANGVAITVAPSVRRIAGAYLAIEGRATGQSSVEPLAVDGNMNANISDLVSARTYVRATEVSSALSTGVTINYSTRALKNPPPLLTRYLEQYNLDRISR